MDSRLWALSAQTGAKARPNAWTQDRCASLFPGGISLLDQLDHMRFRPPKFLILTFLDTETGLIALHVRSRIRLVTMAGPICRPIRHDVLAAHAAVSSPIVYRRVADLLRSAAPCPPGPLYGRCNSITGAVQLNGHILAHRLRYSSKCLGPPKKLFLFNFARYHRCPMLFSPCSALGTLILNPVDFHATTLL